MSLTGVSEIQSFLRLMRSFYGAATPLCGDAELADWLDQCRSERKIGRDCQRGFDEARALLSEGVVPSGRE